VKERFVLIGHPVAQSVSPAIHHQAYELLGREAQYDLCDCPDEEAVRVQVEAIRTGKLRGANVTVPWKKVAYNLADELHQSAIDVGVANVLSRTSEGRVIAYNTDAMALGAELAQAMSEAGVHQQERNAALIVGAGGAALATVVGCYLAGIKDVAVTARRFDPQGTRSEWPGAQELARLGAQTLSWPAFGKSEVQAHLSKSCLLVQATSAGMKGKLGGEELCEVIPWEAFRSGVAYDLVYNPPVTAYLARAKKEGHFSQGGLGMLVGQAAQAIEIWWGKAPPMVPLMSAAQRALGI